MIKFVNKKMAIDKSYANFLSEKIFVEQLTQNDLENIEVYIFEQQWANTSGGFQSIGGSCGVEEITVVFIDKHKKIGFVYFNGKFGYKVEKNTNNTFKFFGDTIKQQTAGCKDYKKKYSL